MVAQPWQRERVQPTPEQQRQPLALVPSPSEPPKTTRPAAAVIARMSKEDRCEFHAEGVLPIGDRSLADEDYDMRPVPQGCPSCYLRGGHSCVNCPDLDVKSKLRSARRQGLILP